MIFLIWLLNFTISWLNAWGCGKSWRETKLTGGWPHFVNWCSAIMSASGFTWCYLVIAGTVGSLWSVEHENGVKGPLLSAEAVDAFSSLGYLVIIAPVLGAGLALTINSWRRFSEQRSLSTGVETAWNSLAQAHNIYGAIRNAPGAFESVLKFFSGSKSDSKEKGLVVALVVFAALAGIMTTYTIISVVARNAAIDRALYGSRVGVR